MSVLAKNYVDELKAHNITKDKLKQRDLDYKVLEERLHATEQELKFEQDRYALLQKGALIYTEDSQGYIDNAVIIPNDFHTSFVQDVPQEIGTIAYNRNRFYKMENGKMIKDEQRYRLYIGGIL